MGTKTLLTPEDLHTLPAPPDHGHYELSGGELITVPGALWPHEEAKARMMGFLVPHVMSHGLGLVYSESLFALKSGVAHQPDVAFVSRATREAHTLTSRVIPFAPDLAVEVISDSEAAADTETKADEYLAAGVAEVWQLYPRSRRVRVRTVDSLRDVQADQVLETPLLPGLRIPVRDLFAQE